MVCKKCGSTNVTVTTSHVVKTKNRSCLWNLFMIMITGGLWIIWMLVRKRKEEVVEIKTVTCNECGYSTQI